MSGLESATYINQLNPLNPSDTLDYVSTGDDHIRLIKSTQQNTFPRVTGPITASDSDLTNVTYLVDTGTVNTMVATFAPVWTGYVAGKGLIIKAANTNTGAVTLNVNSLGAIAVVGSNNNALIGGELISGMIYRLTYNGTSFCISESTGTSKAIALTISPYTGTTAAIKNLSTGTLTLGTNAVTNITCNADGSTTLGNISAGTISGGATTVTTLASATHTITGNCTVSGSLTVSGGITGAPSEFASGTKLPFFQAAAPTGWTQVTTNTDCMLRVVSTAGGGTGGTDSPILNNKITSHTHVATVTDPGHNHTYNYETADQVQSGGATACWTGHQTVATSTSTTGITVSNAVPAGASNWTPKYVDMIICSKN